MITHGGDIYRNDVNIDFSVNISPYGMPPMVRAALSKSLLEVATYPDPTYTSLRNKIAELLGVTPDQIICGNGASELIYAISDAFCDFYGKEIKVGLFAPCFSEYKEAFKASGVREFNQIALKPDNDFVVTKKEILSCLEGSNVVIWGNPNNPTGRLIPHDLLKEAANYAQKNNSYIILDESFLSLTEDAAQTICDNPNVIRIKSFTKSMCMPGVRLGYCICSFEPLRNLIKKHLPEWNVSIPACFAGEACCENTDWLREHIIDSQTGLKKLREEFATALENLGLTVYESDTCFLLVKADFDLYDRLLKQKILIRKCSNFEGLDAGYFRLGVKQSKENHMLIKALKEKSDYFVNSLPQIETVRPADIEKKSFETITNILDSKSIILQSETQNIIKRCIHTTADFDYVHTMCFSPNAVADIKKLIREGASIVTDTNMALSGINKKELSKYGGKVYCFMADEQIAAKAKITGQTRATVSMEHAATLPENIIFVIGNAPTALISLANMAKDGTFYPKFVVGVPVGFVNVEISKNMIMETGIPYIVNKGRKGGSNLAAAIINAVLYEMRDEAHE